MAADDDRYLVVNNRRWRRSDPAIPDPLRAELVAELMDARRAVGAAGRADDAEATAAARRRVQDAKVALGERGAPWWDEASSAEQAARIGATIRTLLRHRHPRTICPSDAARVVGGPSWRKMMPIVREVAVTMSEAGEIVVRQKGVDLDDPAAARGPIRLALG